jgi:hypothetical protein
LFTLCSQIEKRTVSAHDSPFESIVSGFESADGLGQGAHGAEHAPGAGFEPEHGRQSDDFAGQHQAVQAEGELGHPGGHGRRIRPVPGQPERPQQRHRRPQPGGSAGHQPGGIEHAAEHGKEKDHEPVSERPALHPIRHLVAPGKPCLAAQHPQQLSPVAVPVAEQLVAAEDGEQQGQAEADEPQPGKQDVHEPQREIDKGPQPQPMVPMMLLFHGLTSTWMADAGHSRAQRPQPTHRSSSTWA